MKGFVIRVNISDDDPTPILDPEEFNNELDALWETGNERNRKIVKTICSLLDQWALGLKHIDHLEDHNERLKMVARLMYESSRGIPIETMCPDCQKIMATHMLENIEKFIHEHPDIEAQVNEFMQEKH